MENCKNGLNTFVTFSWRHVDHRNIHVDLIIKPLDIKKMKEKNIWNNLFYGNIETFLQ